MDCRRTDTRQRYCKEILLAVLCTLALSVNIVVADIQVAASDLQIVTGASDTTNIDVARMPSFLVGLVKLHQNFPLDSWGWGVCAAALACLLHQIRKYQNDRPSRKVVLLAAGFGFVQTLGLSICKLGNWNFVLQNPYQMFVSLICMAGYGILFYHALWGLYHFLQRPMRKSQEPENRLAKAFASHPARVSALGMWLAWLPWMLVFWPGSVDWDSYGQICQMTGSAELTAHHTVLSTWLHGWCFWAGRFLGSDNLGVFLYILLHSLVCAWAFGRIVGFAARLGCNRSIQYGVTAFFALVPVWGAFIQTPVKDTLFTGLFAAFAVYTAEFILFPESYEADKKHILSYIALALLCCLLRKNGSYAVVPTLLLLLVAKWHGKLRRQASVLLVSTLVGMMGFSLFTDKVLDIPAGSVGEALSVPFQQTARYVSEYGNEVTDQEKAVIDTVLAYDQLAENYNPELSDGVKQFYKNVGKGDLLRYLLTWAEMGLKHPGCYLQATHANSYGYYTICKSQPTNEYYTFIYGPSMEWANLDIAYADQTGYFRYALIQWTALFEKIPLVGLLTSIGFLSWGLFALAYCLLRAHAKGIYPLLVGLLILWLTCIASPVNDCIRYFLPIMACIPLIFCVAIYFLQKKCD